MKGAPDRLAGGSLCDLSLRGGLIHKRYAGPIERGHEKLIREQAWFEMVPIALRNTGSPLFPSTSLKLGGRGRRRTTTLLVETLDRETMTKAILAGRVDRRRAAGWFRAALDVLFGKIYGMRTARVRNGLAEGNQRQRLALATAGLRSSTSLGDLFGRETIEINGRALAGLPHLLQWASSDTTAALLTQPRLFAIHGNLHFDNILIDPDRAPHPSLVSFIDPRGDLLGALYYDLAKVMTSAHSHYDEIHYNLYTLGRPGPGRYELHLRPDHEPMYAALLEVATASAARFARYCGQEPDDFVRACLACEVIHTYSLAFYHLKRRHPDLRRVTAYLLIACLLFDKATKWIEQDRPAGAYGHRLLAGFPPPAPGASPGGAGGRFGRPATESKSRSAIEGWNGAA